MTPGPLPHRPDRAVAAIAAAAVLVTGCDVGQHSAAPPTTAAVSPAAPTVSGPELVRLWETHPPPCDHPIVISGPPADPYHLLQTAMWPTTADVAARLGAVTATGDRTFILGRFAYLDAVLVATQSDIADHVANGTHELDGVGEDLAAQTVIRNQSLRVITLRHDNYVAAVDHVTGELEIGAVLPTGHKYRLDRVCPEG